MTNLIKRLWRTWGKTFDLTMDDYLTEISKAVSEGDTGRALMLIDELSRVLGVWQ